MKNRRVEYPAQSMEKKMKIIIFLKKISKKD